MAALLRGGRTVLYHDRLLTAHDLAAYVERYGVTVLWLTSSLFSSILETHPTSLAGIRELLVGGEALSVPHVRKALDILPNVKLVNGYGPSECTVFSTCYEIPRDLDQDLISVPIGRPVGDRQVYLLDRWLKAIRRLGSGRSCWPRSASRQPSRREGASSRHRGSAHLAPRFPDNHGVDIAGWADLEA